MTYMQFLSLLISWGAKVREHWPLILAVYQAAKALYDAFGEGEQVDGSLALHSFTPDEMDAEERLAVLIDGDALAVSTPGRFYRVFQFLKTTGILDKLLGKAFGS